MTRGMTSDTRQGSRRLSMSLADETLPFIQSMIVVTSPMGDHAPPLLAAMTIRLAKIQRSF